MHLAIRTRRTSLDSLSKDAGIRRTHFGGSVWNQIGERLIELEGGQFPFRPLAVRPSHKSLSLSTFKRPATIFWGVGEPRLDAPFELRYVRRPARLSPQPH
jgi:hypothetical protein